MNSDPAAGTDPRPGLGPAAWLGVAVVIVSASAFIINSPRSTFQSSQKAGQVRSSPESAVPAGHLMASVWKRKPADPAAFERALRGKPDFTAAGRLLGMDTETVQVSPAVTGSGQLPLILLLKEEPDVLTTAGSLAGRRRGGGMRYVVLAEVRQGEAVVLDPLVGRITLPVTDLIESAAETGIFWRPAS